MIVKCWPDFGVFGERDRESTRWRETQQGKVKERERESSLWQESSRSVMVTWQKGGESLSVLPLLCLKIWHLHSQQQQWCNLVTRLWHVYSRPKPGSYLPYQRLYIQRGRSSCFPSDCRGGGINREGWELCSPALQSKERLLTFSTPRVKRTYGVILRIFQTKIAVRLSIVIARAL